MENVIKNPESHMMTYGYKHFVIIPFEYIKTFDENADIELDLDQVIFQGKLLALWRRI